MSALLLADVFGHSRPGFFLFGVLVPLAVVGLVAYGIWELARSRSVEVGAGAGTAAAMGSARVLLDERFARGEIEADDYVQRRTLLDGVPVVAPAGPPVAEPAPSAAPAPAADPAVTTEQPSAGSDGPAGSET